LVHHRNGRGPEEGRGDVPRHPRGKERVVMAGNARFSVISLPLYHLITVMAMPEVIA